jgi:hypothetical protein
MSKADVERKQALLAEEQHDEHPDSHLTILLAAYALGEKKKGETMLSVRAQVADNIVGEFRQVLRANGPNYDGALYARILEALEAAEKYGHKAKRKKPV